MSRLELLAVSVLCCVWWSVRVSTHTLVSVHFLKVKKAAREMGEKAFKKR